jgi:hypothetical protein
MLTVQTTLKQIVAVLVFMSACTLGNGREVQFVNSNVIVTFRNQCSLKDSQSQSRGCADEMQLSARPLSLIVFFATEQRALARAKAHPHFMVVRILTPDAKRANKYQATKHPGPKLADIPNNATTVSERWCNDAYLVVNAHGIVQRSRLPN